MAFELIGIIGIIICKISGAVFLWRFFTGNKNETKTLYDGVAALILIVLSLGA